MKYKTLVVGPVFSRSGYGDHSREFLEYLLDDGRFDVNVVPTRWGDTPMNAILSPIEERILRENLIVKSLERTPDLMFEFTVPTEFGKLVQVRGKKNFGLTAGIEADRCPPEWVEGVNRTDVVIATSEFAKKSLSTQFKLRDGGIFQAKPPIEVVGMGVDPAIFRDAKRVPELQSKIDAIPEEFLFLFVGHWLPGDIGNDRKDVGRLIDLFLRSFVGNRKVALVLKTSAGTHSILDRLEMDRRIRIIRSKIQDAPNVYLVHGDLTDLEMSTLYRHRKIRAFVSLTHGEGFMISGLHFSLSGKPMILPGYSGHLDYIMKGYPTMKVEEVDVPEGGLPPGMIAPGAKWSRVPDDTVVRTLRNLVADYPRYLSLANLQKIHVERNFTRSSIRSKFLHTITRHLSEVPFEEELVLPEVNMSEVEEYDKTLELPQNTVPEEDAKAS